MEPGLGLQHIDIKISVQSLDWEIEYKGFLVEQYE